MTTISRVAWNPACNGLLFVHVLCGAMCSSWYVCLYRNVIIILEFVVFVYHVRMDNHFI